MDQLLDHTEAQGAIEAELNYLLDTGETPYTFSGGPGSTALDTNITPDRRRVLLRDGRKLADRFTLDRNGFHFLRHASAMTDFFDEEAVRGLYYREMEELVKRESGAARVVVFDHTLRTADDAAREAKKIREVVRRVHNDYTEWSGPQRVRDLLPEEADSLLQRRFAIIQVWRPINNPVETAPLAIADAASLAAGDLVVSERRYPGRVGQTYGVRYNPAHRWYWFPRMAPDEALVFKVYDSLKDGRARWTAHTAFDDPTAPSGARPRESIEIRTLAFFD
jgi:hypothetical protein